MLERWPGVVWASEATQPAKTNDSTKNIAPRRDRTNGRPQPHGTVVVLNGFGGNVETAEPLGWYRLLAALDVLLEGIEGPRERLLRR
jgi:hypothetical protein